MGRDWNVREAVEWMRKKWGYGNVMGVCIGEMGT